MNWLEHTIEERKVMLQQVAHGIHLPDHAVEKDWWVTMALKALFETDCAPSLEFKGGTSLSKGWNLIERFSEDIDLTIDHTFFTDYRSKTRIAWKDETHIPISRHHS